ncbi:MAG: GNAT family N-acetyltransferase [Gaiellaceae bacterium]
MREDESAAVALLLAELGYPCSPEEVVRRLRLLEQRESEAALAAVRDGRVVGLAAYRIEDAIELESPVCRLTALVVAGEARREGVGRALVEIVEREALRRGCELLTLTSGNQRGDAHRFYDSLGFAETGRRFAKRLGRGTTARSVLDRRRDP